MSSKFYVEREDVFAYYPELKDYPEFSKSAWANSEENAAYTHHFTELCRYVVYMFDPKSPLLLEKDLMQARKTGMKQAFNRTPHFSQQLLDGEIPLVCDMAMRFIKMVNNYTLTVLVANRELLYKLTSRMIAPMTLDFGDEKEARYFTTMMKAAQDVGKLIASIQEMEAKLFGADNKLISHYAASDAPESTITKTAVERFAE